MSIELLLAPAEYPQKEQKHVHKVEVQSQCSDDCAFGFRLFISESMNGHFFELLCVVGGQSNKNNDTYVGDEPIYALAVEEDVHNRSQDNSDKTHKEKVSKFGYRLSSKRHFTST